MEVVMKRKVLMVILILCLVAGMAFSQPKNAASLNPIGILFNLYMVSYERVITDNLSVNISVAYTPNLMWFTDISAISANPGARYYMGPLLSDLLGDSLAGLEDLLFPPAPLGPFVGAYLGLSNYIGDSFNFGGGVELGYKYGFSDSNFSLFAEPYIGLEFLTNSPDTNGFKYGVNFGVVF